MRPLLLVNTWSHEEESHARCHKHQVGHNVIRSRQVPGTVRRLPLSAGGRRLSMPWRLRASGCAFPACFAVS